jgi:hypothetical protein
MRLSLKTKHHPLKKHHFHAGQRVHSWTLIQSVPDKPNCSPIMKNRWRVECVCGARETLPEYYLTRKAPKEHCGCLHKTLKTTQNREYRIWLMMHERCYNPKHVSYKRYGGRGIGIHPEWHKDSADSLGFERFFEAVGPAPTTTHQIDRWPDNDKGYEPGNVRWATPKENAANRHPQVHWPSTTQ